MIIDLNINICIEEIVAQHYANFMNSNLDLSYIEYYYQISLTSKNDNSNSINEDIFKDFDVLLYCISNSNSFNKLLPFIVNNISDKHLERLLDLLGDDNIDNLSKTNILKVILYSEKRDINTLNKIIEIMNESTQNQKNIIVEIFKTIKSKKILSALCQNNLEDSFVVRLLLNNYNADKYEEVHNKILKLKINYTNSNYWYEVENDLIKYFNKKRVDERLLIDLKFFFKNGLSSTSRYKTAMILKKYNMLDENEIKSLKYDANYKIRQKFKKL